jgi:hypothetical protein
MKSMLIGACVAIGLSTVAFAQQTPAAPATSTTSTTPSAAQSTQTGEPVTLVGCVQREADYRRAQDAGRGGAAGSGVGVGNEFVLANTSPVGTTGRASAGTTTSGTATPSATGTGGTSPVAYELSGPNEGQVAQYVGRRVEIVGRLKPAAVAGSGPTGGPTAGAPPRGVDVLSQDLQLREVEITSVRESTGTCPTARP